MRILGDTNVLRDYVLLREPFAQDARKIIDYCRREIIDGVIAAHSVADMFYILRKNISVDERRRSLLRLCDIFQVEAIDKDKLKRALINEDFSDFEDCLQMECALSFEADCIVTRNVGDYTASKVPCIDPKNFCAMFEDNGEEV